MTSLFDSMANLRGLIGGVSAKNEYSKDNNEMIEQEWTTLKLLWASCRSNVEESDRAKIDQLFPKEPVFSSTMADWYKLNYAEQNVGAHLDEPEISAEYRTLLDLAKERNLSTLPRHVDDKKLFDDPAPPNDLEKNTRKGQKRTAYLALLQALQADFVEGRFHRRLRWETAREIFSLGAWVFALAALPLAVYLSFHDSETLKLNWLSSDGLGPSYVLAFEPAFWLILVATFGILGAFFSRLLTFQAKLSSLAFEDVVNLYQRRLLIVRLLYGMIGAIVFYLIIRSGLIAGAALPELKALSQGVRGVAADIKVAPPIMELTKLLAWSFLAGFSERLLPDTLARVESRAADGK